MFFLNIDVLFLNEQLANLHPPVGCESCAPKNPPKNRPGAWNLIPLEVPLPMKKSHLVHLELGTHTIIRANFRIPRPRRSYRRVIRLGSDRRWAIGWARNIRLLRPSPIASGYLVAHPCRVESRQNTTQKSEVRRKKTRKKKMLSSEMEFLTLAKKRRNPAWKKKQFPSLKLTGIAPENGSSQKIVSQPPIFRGKLAVRFRGPLQ